MDIPQLARDGVTLFFTQVFRDGFFHADMHPGNIMVSLEPESFGRYISLDFGIVGTLTEFDKEYLAQNFLAFSAETTSAWQPCTLKVAGYPPPHVWKSWRPPFVPSVSLTLTARWPRFRWAWC